MLKALTILALVGFTGMAVFSFLGMGEHTGFRGRCLAELASNATCPPNSGPVSASLFHLNAFKTFSTGLTGTLVLGLIALLGLTLMSLAAHQPSQPPALSYLGQADAPLPVNPQLAHWLARLENSPSNTIACFRPSAKR